MYRMHVSCIPALVGRFFTSAPPGKPSVPASKCHVGPWAWKLHFAGMLSWATGVPRAPRTPERALETASVHLLHHFIPQVR